mmetsp:Transcript_1529/g.1964  ORF Transcript_1529/g.1964 Transcript_1529/m.1964 type:complete len:89 (+) Transcript_1529:381-647(+)
MGGPKAGVTQLSAVAYSPPLKKVLGEFNEYVNPGKHAIWYTTAKDITGLEPNDEIIKTAEHILKVWPRFVSFVGSHLEGGNKVGALVA